MTDPRTELHLLAGKLANLFTGKKTRSWKDGDRVRTTSSSGAPDRKGVVFATLSNGVVLVEFDGDPPILRLVLDPATELEAE